MATATETTTTYGDFLGIRVDQKTYNWNGSKTVSKSYNGTQCPVCGRYLSKPNASTLYVEVTSDLMMVPVGVKHTGETLGLFQLGPECAKKPELAPYIRKAR